MGYKGGALAVEILKEDIRNNMIQLGVKTVEELREIEVRVG